MNKELIDKINIDCPYDQGIFFQPYGIPVHIKEHVVYMRHSTGGRKGGNCWGGKPYRYENEEIPEFKVLDILLKEVYPEISYIQFKKIEKIIHTNDETEHEYYGNSTDYEIRYIILSELEKLIDSLK